MKIISNLKFIIPSVVFFIMMEFFFKSFGLSYSSLLTLFLISVLSAFWITKYRLLPIILIMLFATGSVLFLLTLGAKNFQHAYIIFSSVIFASALLGLNRFFLQQEKLTKEEIKPKLLDSGFNLNQTIIMISIFLLSGGIYGLYLDLDFPTWSIMAIIFAGVFFSTLYLAQINFLKSKALGLHLDSSRNKTFLFYSFLFGFLSVEIIWAMSFLPINHLTMGAIILSFYYCLWNILKNYLRNELTRKTMFLNLLFFTLATSMVFFMSKWSIV